MSISSGFTPSCRTDIVGLDAARGHPLRLDLGGGEDFVLVAGKPGGQVRLSFTSAEVGNGRATDGGTLANQDGGLAVRLQAEGRDGTPSGRTSRFDDEGITFLAVTPGLSFDVRDLVSGVQRGDDFQLVRLGTAAGDRVDVRLLPLDAYVNAGGGDDWVRGGRGDDFLVGGAGNDTLRGGPGDDSLLGGGGDDTAIVDLSRRSADSVDLGAGNDVVLVNGAPGQLRLSFTSAEVGNASPTDAGTLANQDGGLAVRLQAETGAGVPAGPVGRFDDEGITFVAGRPGLTFDVRDLVAGTARGDRFEVVRLGTEAGEALDAVQEARPYYINAGMGNDTVTGGAARDFLVGGAGDDLLAGGGGADSLLGGGGADRFLFAGLPAGGTAPDSLVDFAPGTDLILLDDAGFAGLAPGALAPGAFALSTAAAEADDRVIYDQGSGRLFFDADGGTRDDLVAFAVLAPAAPALPPALSAADFLIV